MPRTVAEHASSADPSGRAPGARLEARRLGRTLADGTPVLQGVSFVVEPGELVAIAGGSGAGKTTLLEALAGIRPGDHGSVLVDGIDLTATLETLRPSLGYVPQDDIIHTELPLEATLRYTARLRLPAGTRSSVRDRAVEQAMQRLDLADRAGVRVSALSGGQRKRASIAAELLTEPRIFFLDEPTSGLDPATGAQLLVLLRRLADAGSTVVLTTHAVQDLAVCDTVLFLSSGGRLAFAGPPADALVHFGVDAPEQIYTSLASEEPAGIWAERFDRVRGDTAASPAGNRPADAERRPAPARRPPGALVQWRVLTRRTAESLARNRLTLAILLGSPVMVVAMFAVLFRPGAFSFEDPSPNAVIMEIFWITFGAFFFGLTYGLLQICTELPIVRRERTVGLHLGAYILAKLAVLLPFLLLVVVLMLGVLRALDRLPPADVGVYGSVGVTLLLDAAAALALGLLTSAAVANASQATLALPMLCFPAVLFSGAILPVHIMAPAGQVVSALMPDRWAFEAAGSALEVRQLFAQGGSALGPPLLASFGDAGREPVTTYWALLAGFTSLFLGAAWWTLARRCRPSAR